MIEKEAPVVAYHKDMTAGDDHNAYVSRFSIKAKENAAYRLELTPTRENTIDNFEEIYGQTLDEQMVDDRSECQSFESDCESEGPQGVYEFMIDNKAENKDVPVASSLIDNLLQEVEDLGKDKPVYQAPKGYNATAVQHAVLVASVASFTSNEEVKGLNEVAAEQNAQDIEQEMIPVLQKKRERYVSECTEASESEKPSKKSKLIPCRFCGKSFSAQGLGGHIAKRHRGESTSYAMKKKTRENNANNRLIHRMAQILYVEQTGRNIHPSDIPRKMTKIYKEMISNDQALFECMKKRDLNALLAKLKTNPRSMV